MSLSPILEPSSSATLLMLTTEQADAVSQSDGFAILRQHLAEQYAFGYCQRHAASEIEHRDSSHRQLIVRDVLHALLVPIVELFDKARGLAASLTNATILDDLEYAFSGPARSVYVWLRGFLSSEQERDWCYTRGCPACVVSHCLHSVSTVKLLHAACFLSDVHYPFTIDGPTLPSFAFFLDVLRDAIADAGVYGEDLMEQSRLQALAMRDGVEELVVQCLELNAVLSSIETTEMRGQQESLPGSTRAAAPRKLDASLSALHPVDAIDDAHKSAALVIVAEMLPE